MLEIHYIKKVVIAFLAITLFGNISYTQESTVFGTISDSEGPLIGASILISGTSQGTVTDFDGTYQLLMDPGTYNLIVSYIGYGSETREVVVAANERLEVNFLLQEGLLIDEVVVTGTRASNRTNVDTPVPIDVINVEKLSSVAPQTDINQLLNQSAPSFNSNTQTISDGTDHIDPASLRGLGPDQVLVLLNNKRRHNTSLVNVNGTFGRGNVGTDLNAIPASAVQVIEVLRDGASAQYGSDAIAGVINIKMRETVNELNASVTTGAHFTNGIGPFGGETKNADGEVFNLGLNYGLPLTENGGFINFSGEMQYRGATSRMQSFDAQIFNAYNSIERVAAEQGMDISSLSMNDVQNLASEVDYFTSDYVSAIENAADRAELNALLNTDSIGTNIDVTESELAARRQDRSDYNMRVGQSALRGGKIFYNMAIPLNEELDLEVYSFGGIGYRRGESGCFYRLPHQDRTSTSIYINGTVPLINSNIKDQSFAAGIRGSLNGWGIDFSNVYGSNSFFYQVTNSHNATLGTASPTEFNAGGHSFIQNTSNFDVSRYFEMSSIKGINVAFGTEFRYENYLVERGSELSYGNYDINGNLVNPTTDASLIVTDFLGRARPSGAQCFAGFLPFNDVDANRTSYGAYVDTEFDISEALLLGAALRFEDYSDFGSTFNYKGSARYKFTPNFAIRAAASSGFRAPSLHQINFSRTSTIFTEVNGETVPQEVGVFANNSRAAALLGIPKLTQEESNSYSAGLTFKLPSAGLRVTVDGYFIDIDDRVVLTGQFDSKVRDEDGEVVEDSNGDPVIDPELENILDNSGANAAAFFANAIGTESMGVDVVVDHAVRFNDKLVLRSNLAMTFSQTLAKTDGNGNVLVNTSDVLEDKNVTGIYFDQTSRIYVEQAVPRFKLSLANTLELGKLNIYLRNTVFGETTEATNSPIFNNDLELRDGVDIDPYNDMKLITDLSVGYNFTPNFSLTIGANNLLDIYPDEVDSTFRSDGRFVYSRRSPNANIHGRFLFARAAFTLK